MREKVYAVKVYYTSFCAYEVVANDEYEAIEKARKLSINNA